MKTLLRRLTVNSFSRMTLFLMVWGVALVLYLAYQLSLYRQASEQELQQQQATWRWLKANQPRVTMLHQHLPAMREREVSVEQAAMQTAKQHHITFSDKKMEGQQLALVINNVPFDLLLGWIAQLKQQYAVEVLQMTVQEQPARDGNVKVASLRIGRLQGGNHA